MTIISRARVLDVFQTFRAMHPKTDHEGIAHKAAIALGLETEAVLEVIAQDAVETEGGSAD